VIFFQNSKNLKPNRNLQLRVLVAITQTAMALSIAMETRQTIKRKMATTSILARKVHPKKRQRPKKKKSIKTTKMKKWINNRRQVAKKQETTKSEATPSLRMAKRVARIEVGAVIGTKSARDLVRALKSPSVTVAKNDQKTRT